MEEISPSYFITPWLHRRQSSIVIYTTKCIRYSIALFEEIYLEPNNRVYYSREGNLLMLLATLINMRAPLRWSPRLICIWWKKENNKIHLIPARAHKYCQFDFQRKCSSCFCRADKMLRYGLQLQLQLQKHKH